MMASIMATREGTDGPTWTVFLKDQLRIERTRGLWVTKEEIFFEDDEAMRELFSTIGGRLREISGKLGGAPKHEGKERCPCGEMTLKRAQARKHQCAEAY